MEYIFGFLFVTWLLNSFGKRESKQVSITNFGGTKIPRIFLDLLDKKYEADVNYKDLDVKDSKTIDEYVDKLETATNISITYLENENLVFINNFNLKRNGYFYPTDREHKELYTKKVVRINKNDAIEFCLYRKNGNIFSGPILIGFLRKLNNSTGLGLSEDSNKSAEILFELPERLIKHPHLFSYLMKSHSIKRENLIDYGGKNAIGEDVTFQSITLIQEKYPMTFQFYV